MIPSSILKRFVAFSKNGNVQENYLSSLQRSRIRTRHHIQLKPTLIKCMKIDVFCYKSDKHVRPMRFGILCTPTDNSDKN